MIRSFSLIVVALSAGPAAAQFTASFGPAHRTFAANVTAGPAAGGFRSGFHGGFGSGFGTPILYPVPYVVPVYVPVEVPVYVVERPIITRLSIELPTVGELWLNGVKQPGTGPTFVLDAANLPPGGTATFAVRGRWSVGGVTYEHERTRTLGAGEKHQVVVVRGEAVK